MHSVLMRAGHFRCQFCQPRGQECSVAECPRTVECNARAGGRRVQLSRFLVQNRLHCGKQMMANQSRISTQCFKELQSSQGAVGACNGECVIQTHDWGRRAVDELFVVVTNAMPVRTPGQAVCGS